MTLLLRGNLIHNFVSEILVSGAEFGGGERDLYV